VFEEERNITLNKLCDQCYIDLIEHAFKLKKPVTDLVEVKRTGLIQYIKDNEASNAKFVED